MHGHILLHMRLQESHRGHKFVLRGTVHTLIHQQDVRSVPQKNPSTTFLMEKACQRLEDLSHGAIPYDDDALSLCAL